jgi:hypothetical protein
MTQNNREALLRSEAIQMAHYALGKVEIEQGFQLDWRERSTFINNYVVDYMRSHSKSENDAVVKLEGEDDA